MSGKKPPGVSDVDWEELVAWGREMSDAIERRRCPECGGSLSRVHPMRMGVAIQLNWIQYRCTPECGFMIERREDPKPESH